jgi:hypothetical protein
VRVYVDIAGSATEDSGDVAVVVVTGAGEVRSRRPVRWTGNGRLLVAAESPGAVADPAGLVRDVELGEAAAVREYGGLLFQAAFGAEAWEQLVKAAVAARGPYLELAIQCRGGGDNAGLQGLRGRRCTTARTTSRPWARTWCRA